MSLKNFAYRVNCTKSKRGMILNKRISKNAYIINKTKIIIIYLADLAKPGGAL